MLISFEEFRARLKSLGLPVYRNKAPTGTPFPYFVYSYTNEENLHASGETLDSKPEYQVSLFTEGTEKELQKFRRVFSDVPFMGFNNSFSDENGTTVNNFYTYIRVEL
ncbi:hypothetical protein [Levilactobacillus senmaizukei]|uniref:hypothetical protein n=1 Tax=Levilactobacillus senmaizukei TaxID=431273 RepID=UPI00077BF4F2|nr:hypothetical protein [Levilactobacillus senmaizukei]